MCVIVVLLLLLFVDTNIQFIYLYLYFILFFFSMVPHNKFPEFINKPDRGCHEDAGDKISEGDCCGAEDRLERRAVNYSELGEECSSSTEEESMIRSESNSESAFSE